MIAKYIFVFFHPRNSSGGTRIYFIGGRNLKFLSPFIFSYFPLRGNPEFL
jgi:hypothetical protein